MSPRLDDAQIERYSRHIVLPEVGARGQERLLGARVAIVGTGPAAERVIAYLAAAGVGRIAAPPSLHHAVDPDHTDVVVEALDEDARSDRSARGGSARFDAAVLVDAEGGRSLGTEDERASAGAGDERTQARHPAATRTFWIAGACAGEVPPCPACAAARRDSLVAAGEQELRAARRGAGGPISAREQEHRLSERGADLAVSAELRSIRDALLGTVVATEVLKALLRVGTPLSGHVLSYVPALATVTVERVAPRAGCAICTPARLHGSTPARESTPEG